MKRSQIHFPRGIRKEQIIRETLFLEFKSDRPITLTMICKQLRTTPSNPMRIILNELAADGLVTMVEGVNSKNRKAWIYTPNHDAIEKHYGSEWYKNVMKGIKHRLE